VILYLPAALFALLGAIALVFAMRSLGPYAQVLRRPTIGLDALAEGPVEVAGVLRAVDRHLTTVLDDPAIAIHSVAEAEYRAANAKSRTVKVLDDVAAVPAVIEMGERKAMLDLDDVMLLGRRLVRVYSQTAFEERHPELFKELALPVSQVGSITLTQVWIPSGEEGLVSGEAALDGTVPDGYRGTQQRFRIAGSGSRPLILAARTEAEARTVLARPAVSMFWIAGVAGAFAALLGLVARAVGE